MYKLNFYQFTERHALSHKSTALMTTLARLCKLDTLDFTDLATKRSLLNQLHFRAVQRFLVKDLKRNIFIKKKGAMSWINKLSVWSC